MSVAQRSAAHTAYHEEFTPSLHAARRHFRWRVPTRSPLLVGQTERARSPERLRTPEEQNGCDMATD
jgi:hypothetical protein